MNTLKKMSELENKGWTEWSQYVLKELEKLGESCISLAEEINTLNVELTKISGMKHAINDLKNWKTSVEDVVNVDDLKNIKNFYIGTKDIQNSISSIKTTVDKHDLQVEDYKKFKTQIYTVIAIVSFLFGTALTLISIFH